MHYVFSFGILNCVTVSADHWHPISVSASSQISQGQRKGLLMEDIPG
jgi:hypothetical protein